MNNANLKLESASKIELNKINKAIEIKFISLQKKPKQLCCSNITTVGA